MSKKDNSILYGAKRAGITYLKWITNGREDYLQYSRPQRRDRFLPINGAREILLAVSGFILAGVPTIPADAKSLDLSLKGFKEIMSIGDEAPRAEINLVKHRVKRILGRDVLGRLFAGKENVILTPSPSAANPRPNSSVHTP